MTEDQVETADTTQNDPNKKRNRKKRKNFLSNAKKYGKKGQTGRGTKMSEEMYQYFVGILEAIKAGIEGDEERQALVNNVLERTKEEELNIAGNQLGSRVIELLLPYSSPEDLERFIEVLSPELRRLCSDNFTSHIVETLLRVSCERATEHLQGDDDDDDDKGESDDETPKKKIKIEKPAPKKSYSEEHIKACNEFTIKVSKYALNNLEDFVWDSYANHILRSALKCLTGITLLPGEKAKPNLFTKSTENSGKPPYEIKITYKKVPQEFKDIAKEFATRLSSWPQFRDLPYKNITSGLLQVLLFSMKNVDKTLARSLVKQLLNESLAPDDWIPQEGDDEKNECKDDKETNEVAHTKLPPVFRSESAVRLLEAAIAVSKKKIYTQIYAKCFINRLGQLSVMPKLNFTVQRLLDNCNTKEEFEPMFEELSDRFVDILGKGTTGVLVALSKACLRNKAKQTQFVNNLQSSLNCNSADTEKYFSVLCLRLTPLDKVDITTLSKEYFIHVHGSVILQTIMEYQRPAKAVNGLLELQPEELMVILCDAKGCHVSDALYTGEYVGVKSRDRFVKKLRGYYQKLALSQYGSRAFEQIFNHSPIEQKTQIMTEIAEKSNLLNSTAYGRLIAAKLNVGLFKKSEDKWKKHIVKNETNKE